MLDDRSGQHPAHGPVVCHASKSDVTQPRQIPKTICIRDDERALLVSLKLPHQLPQITKCFGRQPRTTDSELITELTGCSSSLEPRLAGADLLGVSAVW
ncbi:MULTISPECIES: hypothetical protein [unclassified Mesorhizobium]|uniref:Uncharacterized protein n=1 Tax=Mesorhizobium salmacidum TaxID=3015171 RepID=A0ABU8L0R8_9HYPH|nr:hypothetical protein [Mesorhizobium sp. WSM3626]